MVARCFFSFHYANDAWRVSQVRNIGFVDGNRPAADNDWETVRRGGDPAIKRWIDSQMEGRSTVVVMIGSETAGRRWINYEIENGWQRGKAILGVRIHRLLDRFGFQSAKGNNPFDHFRIGAQPLSSIVPILDPGETDSKTAYRFIADHLSGAIETAKAMRGRY